MILEAFIAAYIAIGLTTSVWVEHGFQKHLNKPIPPNLFLSLSVIWPIFVTALLFNILTDKGE